jgi:2-polyprenyl-6-methoxyphenol hydroxylase-like FAD-dependent oxidoreductase
MTSHETFDVVVIGARAAGAATAMLLARSGLDVLLVDRGTYGSDTLSTHALMRGAVLQLRRWGLLDRVASSGTPPVRRTAFHYGDQVVDIAIKPSHGVDALYAPRRTVLDPILVDAARAAGATVRFQTGLKELVRRADGRVFGVVLKGPMDSAYTVGAGLVIGADGTGSTVARLAGAGFDLRCANATAVIYGYWSGLPADAGYHWHYRPGTSVGAIPTTDGRTCVFAAMPPARLKGAGGPALARLYHAVLGECAADLAATLEGATLESRLVAFAGRPGFLRQAFGPGWALVGDAGYFKDPITAHGITDAFRDAELLANAAVRGTEAAFAAYAAERRALSTALLRITDEIAGFGWDLDRLAFLHLALNKAMHAEVEHLADLPALPAAARRHRRTAAIPAFVHPSPATLEMLP